MKLKLVLVGCGLFFFTENVIANDSGTYIFQPLGAKYSVNSKVPTFEFTGQYAKLLNSILPPYVEGSVDRKNDRSLIIKDPSENLLILACSSFNKDKEGVPLTEPRCEITLVDKKSARDGGYLEGDNSTINAKGLIPLIEKNSRSK